MTLSDITVESQGSAVELEEAESYIAQLDLTYIVKAMCAPDYPMPRWTLEDAEHSLVLYKNFMMLLKEYPREGFGIIIIYIQKTIIATVFIFSVIISIMNPLRQQIIQKS
jgi:hypothetical protein